MDCVASHGSLDLYNLQSRRYEAILTEGSARAVATGQDLIEPVISPVRNLSGCSLSPKMHNLKAGRTKEEALELVARQSDSPK